MASQWVMDEMETADLRDKRLERRLVELLDTLSQSSTASIPAACHDRAEMVAAYRFFDNDKVGFEEVLAPHIDATYARLRQQRVALLVQDTTELDLTRPSSEVEGAGPMAHGRRSGAFMHLLHAFTPDGTPLGSVAAEAWTREPKSGKPQAKRGSSEKRVQIQRRPFEEKETYRWLTTSQHCAEVKNECPKTQLVMLADRECDITEVLDYCRSQSDFDWVIRIDGSRVLNKEKFRDQTIAIREELAGRKALYQQTLDIRARTAWGSETIKHRPGKADRKSREVKVSIHSGQITLNDPRAGRYDGVTVNAVLVRETRPGKRDEPIECLLLTSLPIKTCQQAELVIAYYLMRWMIEIFFKVLKSGCKIESRRFEHIDRFLPSLALYMIIAWRSLYVCRVSRSHAQESCERVYSEAEWKSVWQVVRKSRPPRKPPTLMEMTKIVAELGGYINRKNTGPPGPQSMWIGLQAMHIMATCWLAFGPGANQRCV
ncbi:Transposase for transposon Tn5 [Rubripirellula amarantea]|uniref:Transposase for transposon Tn5 n=2 Tax=Rubripirellula amarantea TaxID=2527999 RepID=A0A5C5WNR7_9BACT|nr:IS4 family transposase [Rubripirellula amarantea]TWT51462.1 Transposase for transposon Tn5 [Rubripirellula amarantea]